MKLYVYGHCPVYAKAGVIFALKLLPLKLRFVLMDDAATPTQLAGKNHTNLLYPSLRRLSVVKNVKYPANVKRYMARMATVVNTTLGDLINA